MKKMKKKESLLNLNAFKLSTCQQKKIKGGEHFIIVEVPIP